MNLALWFPAIGNVVISKKGNDGKATLEIYNLQGKYIKTEMIKDMEATISLKGGVLNLFLGFPPIFLIMQLLPKGCLWHTKLLNLKGQ